MIEPGEGNLTEIRLHGRGGQGTVVCSLMLARAAMLEGRGVQSFPEFGVERRGAPVNAYLRVSDRPIRLRCRPAALPRGAQRKGDAPKGLPAGRQCF